MNARCFVFTPLFALTALALLCAPPAVGQPALASGQPSTGTIAAAGESNLWTVAAARGDRIVLQLAKLSGGAGFTPRFEVFSPEGAPIGASAGNLAARLDLQAPVDGSYRVAVADLNRTGTGTYQLQLAKVPGGFTVPAGDEGGPLTNGANHRAAIAVGDLDLWSFSANQGDRIVLQLGETAGGAAFTPRLELFAPDGTRVGMDVDGVAARLDAQAETTGTYTVLVSDSGASGSGSYELHLVQAPGSFVVPGGDEGGALSDGVPADGTIGVGDLDPWTFNANPGDRITLQLAELTGGAGFTPLLEVMTPNGSRKTAGQGAAGVTLEFAVDVGGTYLALVSDATQSGSGTYRLTLTRGAIGPSAANVLSNGGSHLGTISAAGESNVWTFTASAGESIAVYLGETVSGPFLPWLRLFGPTGVLLGNDFNLAGAQVSTRATNSGTYTVVVADGTAARNQTGSYRLSLAKTGSPLNISPTDEGGPLTNGASYLGSIETGDLDAWTFLANAGETFVVWAGETTSGSTLLPWVRVYGPEGALLVQDFNQAAAQVTFRATNSGTYLVVVADGNAGVTGVGNYRLSMAKTGTPIAISPSDEGGPLTNGLTASGGIATGDVDAWTFIANAGESLLVWAGEVTSGSTLLPWVRVFGPEGTLLAQDFNASTAEITVRATNSGTFVVLVSDGNSGAVGVGNYRLTLGKTGSPLTISPLDEGGPLTNGATQLGSIDIGDLDPWTFVASAGENLIVRVGETATGGLLPWARLFGPNGVLLSEDFNAAAAEVTFRATNSGTFMVMVGDGNPGRGGTGGYRISLAKTGSPLTISPSDEGGPLVNGATYLAAIDTGDLDAWTFDATVGQTIIARIGESAAGTLLPWLRLYGPNGLLLSSDANAAAAEVTFRATNSGTFQLVAADGNPAIGGSGAYRLTLIKSGEPLLISPGDEGGPMTGSGFYDGLADVGDLDAWTFIGCAGENLSLRLDEAVAGSALVPWIRLYGRDGVLLNSVSGAATAQIVRTAPATGPYLVVVGDGTPGLGGSGTYRLSVNGLYEGLRLCRPLRNGTNLVYGGGGGLPGTEFVILTSTNIVTPISSWTPFLTNRFGSFGELSFTNGIRFNELQRYFLLRTAPQ